MVKIVKAPSPNMIDAQEQFMRETGKKEIRFGEFFGWLQERTIEKEKREEESRNEKVVKMDLKDIELKDSEFMTVKEKKTVLRQWDRFLKGGMREKDFTKALYKHLINQCSFIAHFDQYGFYATYFIDPEATVKFIQQFDSTYGCVSIEYGATWWINGEYEDINTEMCRRVDKYKTVLYARLNGEARSKDIETAKVLLEKHGVTINSLE